MRKEAFCKYKKMKDCGGCEFAANQLYPLCGNNQSCKRDVERLLYDCMKDKLKCD